MAKKVVCFIASGITALIILIYLITTFMAEGSDWKVMLILIGLIFPFLILGFIGGLIIDKKKILSGTLMLLCGVATVFLGLMCCSGGMPILGILALPLGCVALILYVISAILTFINKQ